MFGSNFSERFCSVMFGSSKWKISWQYLIIDILLVRINFIKKILTIKSNDCKSRLENWHAFGACESTGMHFNFSNCNKSSSEAIRLQFYRKSRSLLDRTSHFLETRNCNFTYQTNQCSEFNPWRRHWVYSHTIRQTVRGRRSQRVRPWLRTVSEMNGDFRRKSPNFPTPCI